MGSTIMLTDEGERMWKHLEATPLKVKVKKDKPINLAKLKFNTDNVINDFLIEELIKLRTNSELVVKDCEIIMEKYKTAEEYIKSEPRIAKTIHLNLIERIDRILNFQNAFDNEDHLK